MGHLVGVIPSSVLEASVVAADPVLSSTLGPVVVVAAASAPYAFAPTISIASGQTGGTQSTVITRASDSATPAVGSSTTLTPTASLSPASAPEGDSWACVTTYTAPSGQTARYTTTVLVLGLGDSTVTAPAATSEAVVSGGSAADKTFSAFTDPDGKIDHYGHAIVDAVGTITATDGGTDDSLGPWAFSGETDGDSFAIILTAYDASNNPLASAVHQVDVAAAPSGSSWASVLDWSSASEAFAAGEGAYTIGGLSTTLSYESSAGPSSISLTSGDLVIAANSTNYAYLVIDLGEDFQNVPLWSCCALSSVSGVSGASAVMWQMADDTTHVNAAGHWQELIGQGGTKTAVLGRWATGPTTFNDVNSRTVTDIETTPTRVAALIDGKGIRPSFDQGTATLPADGATLGTNGPSSFGITGGAYTTSNAANQRYLHLQVKCNATIRLSVAKGA